MATVYQINKGINKPLEFRGLKAQYIGYLAAGLVALLILFAGMYVIGTSLWLCLLVTFALGTLLVTQVYRLSRTFGPYGLLKRAARRYIPRYLIIRSRNQFINMHNGKAR